MSRSVVIVTGVASGIGKAIALGLQNSGYDVIGVDRTLCNYDLFRFFKIDISDYGQVKKMSLSIIHEGIQLSGIVNNAAMQIESSLLEMSIESWNKILNTNLSSVFYMTKYLVPAMESGSIINISSIHAFATSLNIGAYATTKGALLTMTKSLALELAVKGIRVNSVCPGAIDTPMLEKGLSRNGNYKAKKNKLIESTPLKRIGCPNDIYNLVDFLIDNKSENITGQCFVSDGGILAKLASE